MTLLIRFIIIISRGECVMCIRIFFGFFFFFYCFIYLLYPLLRDPNARVVKPNVKLMCVFYEHTHARAFIVLYVNIRFGFFFLGISFSFPSTAVMIKRRRRRVLRRFGSDRGRYSPVRSVVKFINCFCDDDDDDLIPFAVKFIITRS